MPFRVGVSIPLILNHAENRASEVADIAYLVLATQQHAALGMFSGAMMSFVMLLTVITLVVVLIRCPKTAEPSA